MKAFNRTHLLPRNPIDKSNGQAFFPLQGKVTVTGRYEESHPLSACEEELRRV